MHTLLARSIYLGTQFYRREPIGKAMADLRRSEFLPNDELRQLQAERMIAQLRFAARQVPFYRETLASHISRIEKLKDWEDVDQFMRLLGPVEKDEVLTRPAEFTADNIEKMRTYPDKTSGSTGTPLYFPCDVETWAYRHALSYRVMQMYGVEMGEPYAILFGLHWDKKAQQQVKLRDRLLNRVRVSAFDLGKANFDNYYRQVKQHRPTHILGYPSAVYDFCFLAREQGIDLRELKLKAIFLTAEPLLADQRALIEEVSGSRCVNQYGSAEGGFNVFECPAGNLHITIETTWLRTRDPGRMDGEALVTDMLLRSYPMINYAIGDEIVYKNGECDCGRKHPMLGSIDGRSGQPIRLPNGRVINANLPSYIFKPLSSLRVIQRYRFVQRGRDTLDLYMVVSERFTDEQLAIVGQEVRKAFGDDIVFSTHLVERLENLANAKHKCYISLPG